jgi:hypothetical protein
MDIACNGKPGPPVRLKAARQFNAKFKGYLTGYCEHGRLHSGWRILSPKAPPRALGGEGPIRGFKLAHSNNDRAFHEKIAVELLACDGIGIVWQLHLRAAQAHRDGYTRSAEVLIETADAAERCLRRAWGAVSGQILGD